MSQFTGVDYVVIDTPPSLAALTVASLVASDAVFVPLHPEFFGNEGMTALLDMCSRLQKNFNPRLRVGGYSSRSTRPHTVAPCTTRLSSNSVMTQHSGRWLWKLPSEKM
ncbi:ParA family protein [Hymenobacter humi]|uniref:ParA family protein n=1 Tax=Hymenobacter humi TaxID=1411620 RepID=A0ABW2UEZ2_9BACT